MCLVLVLRMEDVRWLKTMLSSELEVRSPKSDKKEASYLAGNCMKLYRDSVLIGYAEMRTVGSHTEITTVLVDPKVRGQGVGKKLIESAIQQIGHNKILCCTKDPAMARGLQKLKFKSVGWPGFWTAVVLSFNTSTRLVSMLIRFDFKRIWRQGKGIHKYERYEFKK